MTQPIANTLANANAKTQSLIQTLTCVFLFFTNILVLDDNDGDDDDPTAFIVVPSIRSRVIMFSTLSSYLPQLGGASTSSATSATITPLDDDEDDNQVVLASPSARSKRPSPKQSMAADEQGVIKKKQQRTHESFIVVRPPPAKNNHPLNLQVQLVPPSSKEQRSLSSKRSFDSTTETDENGAALARTPSNRSEASAYSGNASVTSFSTTASGSSYAASMRRMMIPLYNLQAHNVLTNIIVDAGTDAKVAKFSKRFLEIFGLVTLEPYEVWPGAVYDSSTFSLQRPNSFLIADSAHTPTSSSAVSLASDSPSSQAQDHQQTTAVASSSTSTPQSDRSGPRKFFGNIFKSGKRKGSEAASSPTPQSNGKSSFGSGRPTPIPLDLAQEGTPRSSKRNSLLAAASTLLTSPAPQPPSSPLPQTHFQQASTNSTRETDFASQVLGIQPVCLSPQYPPRGKHPKMYVWVARKWLKGPGTGEGLLDRLTDRPVQGAMHVEVRFEWTRAKTKKDKQTDEAREGSGSARGRGKDNVRKNTASTIASSNTPSLSSIAGKASQQASGLVKRLSREFSRSISRSSSPNPPDSTHTHTTNTSSTDEVQTPGGNRRPRTNRGRKNTQSTEADEEADDPANESDPEDSETPWTCMLIMKPLAPQSPSPSSPQSQSFADLPEVKVKVGAVVPTPHHPKVVSLVKLPFPLPDVDVDRATVHKRVVTPAGLARPFSSPPPSSPTPNTFNSRHASDQAQQKFGLTLTAEEIKDIVSCTGLWIIVREGFGGVGKERRKGDGWRIRA